MKIQSKTVRINGTDLINTLQGLLDGAVVEQGMITISEPSTTNELHLIRLQTLRDKFRCEPIKERTVTANKVI